MKFISNIGLLLLCCCFNFSFAIDTITSAQVIKDSEHVVSAGGQFKFGFFSPGNSTYHYVGIWYTISPTRVVWVANRDNPVKDSKGIVRIYEENLVVFDGANKTLWSTNILGSAGNATAQILDTGNLVLREGDSRDGRIIWESFEHNSDTLLPKARLRSNKKTGLKQLLTSWKSPSDPSTGSFSLGLDPLSIPEAFIWNENRTYWRSGPWNNQIFIGIPNMYSVYLDGFSVADDTEGSIYMSFSFADKLASNLVLTGQGKIILIEWDYDKGDWAILFEGPKSKCDIYGTCGEFGSCNIENSPICSCLRGFKPKEEEEWNRGNWTSGCIRKTALQCGRAINGSKQQKDGFLKLETMKVPAFAEWSSSFEEKCRIQCLENCSCIAYSYYTGIGCMSWSQNLIDVQKFSTGGVDLYIRVADSELDKKKDNKLLITIMAIFGSAIIAICTYLSWRLIKKRGKGDKNKQKLLVSRGEASSAEIDSSSEVKIQELPIFSFENLASATNNFDPINKLGQGGFGPVYKGKLQDGQEIAVKRLSRASGQGVEEFMNEVKVISKLQHRNLVRLLGCSVERDENMLVYECMPNKSLDAFLLDPVKRKLLDWRKRYNIIEGIARGLLYLHRDSRVRIIHRDLKPSNILLDKMLNPKISDFGMARIFRGNEHQANTLRVVGTYGYMSPEYAMEGRFSEKSDVFSFGVLLLEIISGRKNTNFHEEEHSLSLLGHAWKLWSEENIAAMIDALLSEEERSKMEILRCINVGLLCVQEYAEDRPTMSSVISMLRSEIVNLPRPMQPAFTGRQVVSYAASSENSEKRCSVNNITITAVDGR